MSPNKIPAKKTISKAVLSNSKIEKYKKLNTQYFSDKGFNLLSKYKETQTVKNPQSVSLDIEMDDEDVDAEIALCDDVRSEHNLSTDHLNDSYNKGKILNVSEINFSKLNDKSVIDFREIENKLIKKLTNTNSQFNINTKEVTKIKTKEKDQEKLEKLYLYSNIKNVIIDAPAENKYLYPMCTNEGNVNNTSSVCIIY